MATSSGTTSARRDCASSPLHVHHHHLPLLLRQHHLLLHHHLLLRHHLLLLRHHLLLRHRQDPWAPLGPGVAPSEHGSKGHPAPPNFDLRASHYNADTTPASAPTAARGQASAGPVEQRADAAGGNGGGPRAAASSRARERCRTVRVLVAAGKGEEEASADEDEEGVVELGAARGYWARLLWRRGVAPLTALDVAPPEGRQRRPVVAFGTAESLREIKGDTLLLCMPSPGEEQRLAERAVHLFEGGAPSARLVPPRAQAAPTHSGAQPQAAPKVRICAGRPVNQQEQLADEALLHFRGRRVAYAGCPPSLPPSPPPPPQPPPPPPPSFSSPSPCPALLDLHHLLLPGTWASGALA